MTDLVIVSLEDWDQVWRRNQHLVAGLLRAGYVERVLFVEPAADPVHTLRRRQRPQRGRGLRHIDDITGVDPGRLWAYQPTKWLPRRFDASSDRRWATSVRHQAKLLGFTGPVLWVNDPLGAELLDGSWPALYDITDDWLVADRPTRELARLREQEEHLLAECREVIVCSPVLERTKSPRREVVLISNAVDLDAYRIRQPRPSDLPAGPVATYLGTAHRDRIDINLLVATAQRLAIAGRGTVVLVGPAPLPGEDLERLTRARVHVLGPRPSQTVPAYLQNSDVLLVPHVLTEFTASLDPIKAYEYRAARRPVVSTPVAGFVDTQDPLVETVGRDDFPDAVVAAFNTEVPSTDGLPDDIPSWSQQVDRVAEVIAYVVAGTVR